MADIQETPLKQESECQPEIEGNDGTENETAEIEGTEEMSPETKRNFNTQFLQYIEYRSGPEGFIAPEIIKLEELADDEFVDESGGDNFGKSSAMFDCNECDYNTESAVSMYSHKWDHKRSFYQKRIDQGDLDCSEDECPYQADSTEDLFEHLYYHEMDKKPDDIIIYKCQGCSYMSYKQSHLLTHERVHMFPTYKCAHCDYEAENINDVNDHSEMVLKCVHCDFETYHLAPLMEHRETHTSVPTISEDAEEREENVADKADTPVKQQTSFTEEVSSELKESSSRLPYNFYCDECDYHTLRKGALRNHKWNRHGIHENDTKDIQPTPAKRQRKQRIPCKERNCDFFAGSIEELSDHMLKHINNYLKDKLPVYRCTMCPFESICEVITKQHVEDHNTTFRCNLCPGTFKAKRALANHMAKKHNNDYPLTYKCGMCEVYAKRKVDILTHCEQFHKGNIVIDEICTMYSSDSES